MDQDDDRDEAIVSARIAGTSSRALAKQYGCSSREIEEAVERRLGYALDNGMRVRMVKLSVARIEALIFPFFERAVKDKDVAAGTLCCKLEERLALLLGLDQPITSRLDVYQVQAEQEPKRFDKIYETVMRFARPNGQQRIDGDDGNGQLAGHEAGTGLPDHTK